MLKLNKLNQAIQRGYRNLESLIKTGENEVLFCLEPNFKPSGTVSTSTFAKPENKQSSKDIIDGIISTVESIRKDAEPFKIANEVRFWDALRELAERDNQERPADKKRPPLAEKRPPNANVFIGTMLADRLIESGATMPEWVHFSPMVPVDAIIIFYEDIANNKNGGLNRGFY